MQLPGSGPSLPLCTQELITFSAFQTSVAREILRLLDHVPNVLIISQDSFYRHHSPEEIDLAFSNELDFDHPSAIDFDLFREVLEALRKGGSVEVSARLPVFPPPLSLSAGSDHIEDPHHSDSWVWSYPL